MKSLICTIAATALTLGAAADDTDDLFADLDDAPAQPVAEPAAAAADAGSSDSFGAATDDGGAVADDGGEAVGEGEEGALAEKPMVSDKIFHIIPYCRMLEGIGEVMIPGQTVWTPIVEGKYYPLGSIYRTVGEGSRLKIRFGNDAEVSVVGEASFSTRPQKLSEKSRSVGLVSGTITVKVPSNLTNGMFQVTAPGFTVKNLRGESRYTYSQTGDGDEAIINCVTQTLSIEGPHFVAPVVRVASEVRIRTSQDRLMTALYGSRGDVMFKLDQGQTLVKDFGTGETRIEEKPLDWKLSPLTAVRIHRARPAIGERMSVTVMTFDARGELKNRCAFAEKRPEVNSGELGPTSKKEREELAKRAASATAAEAGASEVVEVTDAGEDAAQPSEQNAAAPAGGEDPFGF